jgi:general secretion pathway protein G
MKSAFAMVELIFVIVIIGILAAVAIPKINATRDDAKVAAYSHSVATGATEIASYAIAQGTITGDLTLMSNAIDMLVDKGEATVDGNGSAYFQMGNDSDCLQFKVVDGISDANLTLGYGLASDELCNRLQLLFDDREFPIPLRGRLVEH